MKYGELQGLRGLAILAVLFYHIWPKVFWNGFLGVDMFFVLSGFLMVETNLKSLKEPFNFGHAQTFWYRRIRRIVPLALLVAFGSWIFITKKLVIMDYKGVIREVYCALGFVTNFCAVKDTKFYFHENDIQYFKHYWSLGVEMQFYAVVPLFFAIFTRISTKATLFIALPIIVGASILLQTILFIAQYPEAGFALLVSRLWQFGAGFVVFYVRKFSYENRSNYLLQKNIVGDSGIHWFHGRLIPEMATIITIFIIFFPKEFEVSYMIILVTIFTAVVIICSTKDDNIICEKRKTKEFVSWILTVDVLQKLGDASFAIYVTHWIVQHCFWVMAVDFELFNTKLVCFYTIFVIGFAVHHGIEKPLLALRHSKITFFKTLFVAYGITVLTVYTTHDADSHTTKLTQKFYDEATPLITNRSAWMQVVTQLNDEKTARLAVHLGNTQCGFYPRSEYSLTRVPRTFGVELNGTGTMKFLIIGNSHAECVFPAIDKALGKENYKELNMLAVPGVTPFVGFRHSDRLWQVKETIEHYAPDILFLIFKYQEDILESPLTHPVKNDTIVVELQKTLDYLSKKVKLIFVAKDHVLIPRSFNIFQYAQGVSLQVFGRDYSFDERYREDIFKDLHTRWQAVDCPKCVIIDMWPAFCSEQRCSPLDITQTVPLFWDDNHVTLFGSNLMTPLFKNYLENNNLINRKVEKKHK